jgi:isoleucyl-tRNA synthetase
MNDMEEVRGFVTEGLSLRAKAGLKVRQPLASVTVPKLGEFVDYESILKDELNVKAVKVGSEIVIDEKLTPELGREGMMREIVRVVQAARKKAGLNVDDRISLVLATDEMELQKAIDEHSSTIKAETLAEHLTKTGEHAHTEQVKVEGIELTVSLEKA